MGATGSAAAGATEGTMVTETGVGVITRREARLHGSLRLAWLRCAPFCCCDGDEGSSAIAGIVCRAAVAPRHGVPSERVPRSDCVAIALEESVHVPVHIEVVLVSETV